MKKSFVARACGIGVLAGSLLVAGPGMAAASGYCTWTEQDHSVKFTCHPTGTSFSVCIASAQFAAYLGRPVTKRTNSFGGSATLSDSALYLVRGSETCSAS